jgi:integrase
LPAKKDRRAPYIYRDDEICALMDAASTLRPPLRAATFRTLIGLLACTGLRIGEALALDRNDVDLTAGLLTVRDSKFGKSREVLLHPSTVQALLRYGALRDRLCPRPKAPSFFVTTLGTRPGHATVHQPFRGLLKQARITHPTPGRHVRPHDLRHSFAVKTLLGWYRDGADVAPRMPLLSTYLGHVDPAATFWYLSAAPELLALAAERLEPTSGGLS